MAIARTVPRSKSSFSWTGGWTATSPRGAASIARKYGDPASAAQIDWLNAPPVDNPNLTVAPGTPNPVTASDASMLRDASTRAATDTSAAANTAQREDNSAAAQVGRELAAIPGQGATTVQAPTVAGATVPATTVNPHTGAPTAEQEWMDRGGSEATLHRAQVRAGIRPRIDARTVHSPMEGGSDASNQIISGFGSGPGQDGHSAWPATTFGNQGGAIWDAMTQKFNATRSALQAKLKPAATPTAPVVPSDSSLD